MQRAACNMQHTTYNTLRAACSVQRAAYNMQRAAYNMQHAAYNMQHTPPNTRRAACAMQRTNAIHRAAGKIKLVVSKEKTRKNGFRCIGRINAQLTLLQRATTAYSMHGTYKIM